MANRYGKRTYEIIYKKAIAVCKTKKGTMSVDKLAAFMHNKNCISQYGTPYLPQLTRGTYAAVSATYRYALETYGQDAADIVATAFVKPDGTYAYKS